MDICFRADEALRAYRLSTGCAGDLLSRLDGWPVDDVREVFWLFPVRHVYAPDFAHLQLMRFQHAWFVCCRRFAPCLPRLHDFSECLLHYQHDEAGGYPISQLSEWVAIDAASQPPAFFLEYLYEHLHIHA